LAADQSGGILPIKRQRVNDLSYNRAPMRDAAIALKPLVATIARDVTWGDCDPAGIIFYPNYFRWIDSGTWNLFFTVGLTPERMRAEYPQMDMPIVSAQLEFANPAPFGARAEVHSFIEHWGSKSFRVRHDIVRADGARLGAGTETRAWVCMAPGGAMRAERIPEGLKSRFFVTA
jgi:4-hydroxybenzoyl-CoA thioesterase